MNRLARIFFAMAALAIATSVAAQSYPSKPIKMIIPYVPGGAIDASARTVGAAAGDSLGQPIVIENRPGGSSIIGMQACAKSPPDGYTLCMTVADSLSYNPHMFRNLPYDPDRDFAPVINLVRGVSMLFASGNAPFASVKDMVAYAKANPGKINWGTWGVASIPDIYLQWLKHQAGVDIAAVPYKGAGQAVPAALSGEVDVTFMAIGAVLPHIKSGKVKPLAVVGRERSALLPDVPALAETGLDPGLRSYFGIFAPGGTPRPIVERLNAEFNKALQVPKVQQFFHAQTLEIVGGSADQFAQFLKEDRAIAGKVFQAIGVKPSDAPSS